MIPGRLFHLSVQNSRGLIMAVKGEFECKSRHAGRNVEEDTLSPKWPDFEWFSIHVAFVVIFMRLCKGKQVAFERVTALILFWAKPGSDTEADRLPLNRVYLQSGCKHQKNIKISSEACHVSLLSGTLLSQYL